MEFAMHELESCIRSHLLGLAKEQRQLASMAATDRGYQRLGGGCRARLHIMQPPLPPLLLGESHLVSAATQAKLAARNMEVGSLHGEMSKQERQRVLQAFRDGEQCVAVLRLQRLPRLRV